MIWIIQSVFSLSALDVLFSSSLRHSEHCPQWERYKLHLKRIGFEASNLLLWASGDMASESWAHSAAYSLSLASPTLKTISICSTTYTHIICYLQNHQFVWCPEPLMCEESQLWAVARSKSYQVSAFDLNTCFSLTFLWKFLSSGSCFNVDLYLAVEKNWRQKQYQ